MALGIKRVGGTSLQVEDAAGRWIIFTLDELRSHSTLVSAGSIGNAEGAPAPPDEEAELFAWAAFAAARGYAAEHGLIAGH